MRRGPSCHSLPRPPRPPPTRPPPTRPAAALQARSARARTCTATPPASPVCRRHLHAVLPLHPRGRGPRAPRPRHPAGPDGRIKGVRSAGPHAAAPHAAVHTAAGTRCECYRRSCPETRPGARPIRTFVGFKVRKRQPPVPKTSRGSAVTVNPPCGGGQTPGAGTPSARPQLPRATTPSNPSSSVQ